VAFSIDGTLKWTDSTAPYQFDGDPNGVLDTSTLSNGSHTLAVKAYAVTGRTASTKSSVTVANVSTATAPVPDSIAAPSGTVQVGQELAAATVTWTGTQPITYSYQWQRCSTSCSDISGATGSTYTLISADAGSTIQVLVSARNSAGSATATSAPTSVVQAPPPPSGSIPRFGIATGYKILNRTPAARDSELDQIQAIGAKLVRFDSTPGSQAQVDPVVSGVLARGMEPILILFGTTGPISPSTAASFAGSQAAKWKGRVRLYEFANEPDLHGWTGTTYAQALIAAYDAIKAADPNAIVIAGALWKGAGGPVQFVTDMYNAGAKGHFDILSLHLYDDPYAAGAWNIWNMAFHTSPSVRSVMDAHGDQAIRIAGTEAGGPMTTYGEDGQATIVGHDFDALSDPRLAFILVYAMMDDDVSGFGLLRPDLSERPAWTTYRNRAGAFGA
jgi:hypothetical protein